MAEHSKISVTVKSNQNLQIDSENSSCASADADQSEKAYFPILICESTTHGIPSNLQTIVENLNHVGGSDSNKFDILVSAFFVLMIETGFIPVNYLDMLFFENIDFHIDRVLAITDFPLKWKNSQSNSYKFNFALQPFPYYVCKLTCLSINTNLIVNLVVKDIGTFTTQFNVNKYVPCDYCKKIRLKFRYLNELSMEFKENISLPAKYAILREEGMPGACLQDMPTEILYKIFLKVDALSFLRLTQTCKRMKDSAKFYEHNVWKRYFEAEFPNAVGAPESSWNKKYRDELLRRKRAAKIKRHFQATREFHEFF